MLKIVEGGCVDPQNEVLKNELLKKVRNMFGGKDADKDADTRLLTPEEEAAIRELFAEAENTASENKDQGSVSEPENTASENKDQGSVSEPENTVSENKDQGSVSESENTASENKLEVPLSKTENKSTVMDNLLSYKDGVITFNVPLTRRREYHFNSKESLIYSYREYNYEDPNVEVILNKKSEGEKEVENKAALATFGAASATIGLLVASGAVSLVTGGIGFLASVGVAVAAREIVEAKLNKATQTSVYEQDTEGEIRNKKLKRSFAFEECGGNLKIRIHDERGRDWIKTYKKGEFTKEAFETDYGLVRDGGDIKSKGFERTRFAKSSREFLRNKKGLLPLPIIVNVNKER